MPRSTSCANSAPMPVYGRLTPTFTSWACAGAVVMASAATATATIRFIMRESLPGGFESRMWAQTAGANTRAKAGKGASYAALGARVARAPCAAKNPVRQCGSRTGGQRDTRRTSVAKFKIITPSGASFSAPGAGYKLELEALAPIDAEIVEIAAKTHGDFAKEGRAAAALYAKGRRVTKTIIDGLPRCKVIALGSVGVDSVDVAAATARGIPVTNVPDTFIEEVADHAMMLILATYR